MIIAFSGLKGSGKDSAAKVLIEEYGFTKVALADPVRDFAYAINPLIPITDSGKCSVRLQVLVDQDGWDHCKRNYHEVRRLMQAVGTEGGRTLFGENFWIDRLNDKFPDLFSIESRFVITDCRFKNEGDFVQSHGGLLCWVQRPGVVSDGHASETEELRPQADFFFNNNDTQEQLEEDVRFFALLRGIAPVNVSN